MICNNYNFIFIMLLIFSLIIIVTFIINIFKKIYFFKQKQHIIKIINFKIKIKKLFKRLKIKLFIFIKLLY